MFQDFIGKGASNRDKDELYCSSRARVNKYLLLVIAGKWVGESEKAIREVFRKAYGASPCVLFFDEIDSIAVKRGNESRNVNDRILSQFLVEMDGISIQKQVFSISNVDCCNSSYK